SGRVVGPVSGRLAVVHSLRPVLGEGGIAPPTPFPRRRPLGRSPAVDRSGDARGGLVWRTLEPNRGGCAGRGHAGCGRVPARSKCPVPRQSHVVVPSARRTRAGPGATGGQPVPRRHARLFHGV